MIIAQTSLALVSKAPAAGLSALLFNLAGYWKLDETSNGSAPVTRIASVGNDLTDNNTVASIAAKINNGASFIAANSEFLSHVSSPELQTGDIDFTWACWLLSNDVSVTRCAFAKADAGGSGTEYCLRHGPTTGAVLQLTVSDGAGFGNVQATNFGPISNGVAYFVALWHDSVNNLLGISVNAGAANTAAWTTGVQANANGFAVGRLGEFNGQYWNGWVDELGFWKNRVLSSADITDLYNATNGKSYPF